MFFKERISTSIELAAAGFQDSASLDVAIQSVVEIIKLRDRQCSRPGISGRPAHPIIRFGNKLLQRVAATFLEGER